MSFSFNKRICVPFSACILVPQLWHLEFRIYIYMLDLLYMHWHCGSFSEHSRNQCLEIFFLFTNSFLINLMFFFLVFFICLYLLSWHSKKKTFLFDPCMLSLMHLLMVRFDVCSALQTMLMVLVDFQHGEYSQTQFLILRLNS